jgi:hypothetical protein
VKVVLIRTEMAGRTKWLSQSLLPNLAGVHIQPYALWRFDGFGLGDQLAIDRGQPARFSGLLNLNPAIDFLV